MCYRISINCLQLDQEKTHFYFYSLSRFPMNSKLQVQLGSVRCASSDISAQKKVRKILIVRFCASRSVGRTVDRVMFPGSQTVLHTFRASSRQLSQKHRNSTQKCFVQNKPWPKAESGDLDLAPYPPNSELSTQIKVWHELLRSCSSMGSVGC